MNKDTDSIKQCAKNVNKINKKHEKFMRICLKDSGVPKKFNKSVSLNAYEILVENIKII